MPFGFTLPSDVNGVNIRARGFVTGGECNGSSWFVETVIGPPLITSQFVSRTNKAGSTASFSLSAAGSATLAYHWWKGGVALTNGAKISGAKTASLTISNVLTADAAAYFVVISNSFSSRTSQVATLTWWEIRQLPFHPPT